MDKDLESLIGRLKGYTEGCENKILDFQGLKFEAVEGEMRLYNEFHGYYFKRDPKNPKDPKIVHAMKQFCTMMKVPHPFFIKNPDHMKNQIVSCWLPTLKPEQAVILAKLRGTPDKNKDVIRAILPVESANISNAEAMEMVAEAVGDSFKVEFIIGGDRDDLILHVRFLSSDVFEVNGEQCTTGFSVITSELGAAPITVETFLYRVPSKAALLATYSGESFFESNYQGIQPADLKKLFPDLIARLKEQLWHLKTQIHQNMEAVTKKDDIKELLRGLRLRKGLNDKFHTLLFQELEANPVTSRWEFVNRMAILAKDFDVTFRLKIERAAGELAGLLFDKA